MTQSFEFQSALAAARNGDARALDSLFDRFYPQVKRMVHRSLTADLRDKRPWLVSAFSTGDVVQEVFRHVVRDFDSFAGTSEAAFVSYLATLIKNRLVDAIRFHEAVRRDRRRLRPDRRPRGARRLDEAAMEAHRGGGCVGGIGP